MAGRVIPNTGKSERERKKRTMKSDFLLECQCLFEEDTFFR